jgi:transketolase
MKHLEQFLAYKAFKMRIDSVLATTEAGSGHPTSALSAADIVAVLFFHTMKFDPENPSNPDNDRFILSKGHAAPILYAAWKELGLISDKEILSLRKIDSPLEGHPTPRFSRSEAATGSLGQGLSIGLGMSLSGRLDKRNFRTYVLLGDSEVSEGQVWEAAELAAYYKTDTLVGIIDVNRLGQIGETMEGYDLENYARKFEAFGWKTIIIDGHDIPQIIGALDEAARIKEQPTMIIAKTVKGYGVDFAANKNGFHGKAFSKEELPAVLASLKEKFPKAAVYKEEEEWEPQMPQPVTMHELKKMDTQHDDMRMSPPNYTREDAVATRVAYGEALASLGMVDEAVVSLDGEVKNSTYAQLFEKAHPARFFECFIAEQNMVGMGVGMAARGKVPYISTFACFFTRAYDQIRMAAIGRSTIRLVGSHAGVSIGEDGPSQMGLEDIAMLRAVPESIVLYPSDAVSTWKLVGVMKDYHKGISYLRTTRGATPILYDNKEEFVVGGSKVLRSNPQGNVACVIAAGITVFEALKAYDLLQKEGIDIGVIDLYSVKPLDEATLYDMAQKSDNHLITVEDHYLQGGIGQAVAYAVRNHDISIDCLAVTKLPQSGSTKALMAYEGIDAEAIVAAVKRRVQN